MSRFERIALCVSAEGRSPPKTQSTEEDRLRPILTRSVRLVGDDASNVLV